MKRYTVAALVIWSAVFAFGGMGSALGQAIKEIKIEGNAKVESDAILNLLGEKVGQELQPAAVRKDIRALYDLGYFSDVRVLKEPAGGGVRLVIVVEEKPAVASIAFEGLKELSEDDVKKGLETKIYTIVNESTIAADMRMIEKKYTEKGFFLAKVTYTLDKKGKNEVDLTFHIDESGKVLVGDVFILGNQFFPPGDLLDRMALRPYTRWSATLGAPSQYQEDMVKRDGEFLAYYYKDYGFADVKVGKPIVNLDANQRFVNVTFEVEEGKQYYVSSITVSGDVGEGLYQKEELLELMQLKPTELFRYSRFARDIEMLVDKYGDLGYAYVDVNPLTNFDAQNQTVAIDYRITKGEKVYFGEMSIIGNTKTRDNVIRRELEVHDSELYSGTRMTQSKANVNRLGFFEEVQILKERDSQVENLLNLKIKVKEKPTGQLQAAVGYSPGADTKQALYGQGRYDEKNQSGKGWNTNVTLKWGGWESYKADLGFYDPRVNDSQWSLGLNLSHEREDLKYPSGIIVPEVDSSVSLSVGRTLFELVRANVTARHMMVNHLQKRVDVYLSGDVRQSGIKNSLILGVGRRDLDNFIDPTQGTDTSLRHNFTGGPLMGNYQYMESSGEGDWFLPIDFSDTYRTYFKFHGFMGKLWRMGGKDIPSDERYRLGGPFDLRGYEFKQVSPKDRRGFGPQSGFIDYPVGGDKKFFLQLEYFVPLIPQAGIKALVFTDIGRVFLEAENYDLDIKKYSKDVGFGLRWITPIAPFRFEWAYPYDEEKKQFGESKFIFNIGF